MNAITTTIFGRDQLCMGKNSCDVLMDIGPERSANVVTRDGITTIKGPLIPVPMYPVETATEPLGDSWQRCETRDDKDQPELVGFFKLL